MQVTIDILRQWFEEFNTSLFGNELPMPILRTGRSRSQLGSFSCTRRPRLFGARVANCKICVSNYYDMDEKAFKNVLIHEMIHYFIAYKKIKDTSSHGVVFRKMMAEINACGWNIEVRTSCKKWSPAEERKSDTTYLVLSLELSGNRHMLSVVNPRYARAIERQIHNAPEVKSYKWYTSISTFFSDFPKVRSPRGRIVTHDILNTLLPDMHAVEVN